MNIIPKHFLLIHVFRVVVFLLLAGCHEDMCIDGQQPCIVYDAECNGDGIAAPLTGHAQLIARTTFDDYELATLSFTHATTVDWGQVNNDWDLLFGNDQNPDMDTFSVNMVVDDNSYIVDLGPIDVCDVPERINPNDYEVGYYGDHDDVAVHEGHVYVVRTADSNTRQFAAFRVIIHDLNYSVSLDWFRSPDPFRFEPPASCTEL